MTLNELKKRLQDCGVVGAGGSGFPTHLKLDDKAETLILNCAECEPLLKVHQQLLIKYKKEIIGALDFLSNILQAEPVIAVKRNYNETVKAVREELKEYPRMRLVLLEDVYPVGDEVLLLYEAAGVFPKPGLLPIDCGCLVFNVETLFNIYQAAAHNKVITHKWVTIAGEVKKPVTALIPVGTSIKDAAEKAGGVTTKSPVYLTGGPMMGELAGPGGCVLKTTNAIIVLPESHWLVNKLSRNLAVHINRAASACCQCRSCTERCPRYLIGYPIQPHRVMRALGMRDFKDTDAYAGVLYCGVCGLCERISCPQGLSPRSLIQNLKEKFINDGIKTEPREPAPIHPARAYRQVKTDRLTIRLGLAEYDVPAPLRE